MFETVKQHLWELFVLVVGSVMLVLVEFVRRRFAQRPPTLLRFNEAHQRIHQLLAEARVRLRANRAFVVQFRNGQKFDIHAPLFRLYMTHEVDAPGIAPITPAWSSVPSSQVYEVLTPLYPGQKTYTHASYPCALCAKAGDCAKREIGEAYWLRVKMLAEGTLKSMLIQQGTLHLLVAPMLDDQNVVGFVGVDYRTEEVEFHDDECDYVCHASANIVYELQRAVQETSRSWVARLWRALWSSKLSKQAGTDE